MSAHDAVRAFITDPVLQKRLAKYMVLQCFRNSALEDLHAGISPSSAVGDYSDVQVSSPYGTIPWPEVSRFNDDEMKALMIDVVNRTYRFIHTLFDENTGAVLLLQLAERDFLPRWNEPTLSEIGAPTSHGKA
jgi:ligand-binding SRPBCC domain-containing protein